MNWQESISESLWIGIVFMGLILSLMYLSNSWQQKLDTEHLRDNSVVVSSNQINPIGDSAKSDD